MNHSSTTISVPFKYILNLSLKNGTFLDQLTIAKVIPLFKSGDRCDIKNYRLISILPDFSKSFEKIISHRLINYLGKKNLLTEHQHGFRDNLLFLNLLQWTGQCILMFGRKIVCCRYIHRFVKSFRYPYHNILLRKCEFLGIRGITKFAQELSWLQNTKCIL